MEIWLLLLVWLSVEFNHMVNGKTVDHDSYFVSRFQINHICTNTLYSCTATIFGRFQIDFIFNLVTKFGVCNLFKMPQHNNNLVRWKRCITKIIVGSNINPCVSWACYFLGLYALLCRDSCVCWTSIHKYPLGIEFIHIYVVYMDSIFFANTILADVNSVHKIKLNLRFSFTMFFHSILAQKLNNEIIFFV